MKTDRLFIILVMTLFVLLLFSCTSEKGKKSTPNIIVFLVDDLGWQETSVPFYEHKTSLNNRYRTPNIETLANEGVKFTQFYATAIGSTSRINLMTGINESRHRVTSPMISVDPPIKSETFEFKSPDWNQNGLSANRGQEFSFYAETLPTLLNKSGYRTIHIGKANFGIKDTSGENPLNLGFEINIGGYYGHRPGSYFGLNNFSASSSGVDAIWDIPALQQYHGQDIFLTEALTLEANKEIEKAVEDENPFFLFISHYANHSTGEKDNRFYPKYEQAGLNEFDAIHAAMVEGVDKSLGDIMSNLEDLGIDDNTIIIFLSENGTSKQTTRNFPLRGHELTPYEGGARVPMIIKWPNVVKEASSNDRYVVIQDMFPTVLEMAGINDEMKKEVDGVSFVPLLTKNGYYPENRSVFWHFPNASSYSPFSIIRKGPWKLIYHHLDRNMELFNLDDDLSEKNDLLLKHSDKSYELGLLLSDYLKSVKAQMPVDLSTGDFVEYPEVLMNPFPVSE